MQSNWTSCFRGQVEDFRPFGSILGIEEEGKALTGGDMIVVGIDFLAWRFLIGSGGRFNLQSDNRPAPKLKSCP